MYLKIHNRPFVPSDISFDCNVLSYNSTLEVFMKRFKFVSLLLSGLLALSLLTSCSKQSTLVVGIDQNFPPMGFQNQDGKIVGFDIDMATEAAARLGMDVKFRPIDWSQKEKILLEKRVDVIWNGLTVTEERKKNILFTRPYMQNTQEFVVKQDSPVKSKSDLYGKLLGLQHGSSAETALAKDSIGSFLQNGAPVATENNMVAFMDLDAGRIDAVAVDSVMADYYIAQYPGKYRVLPETLCTEQFAVGFRRNDSQLRNNIQSVLDAMYKDGTSAKFSKKWFGKDVVLK